jgi:hypothetical protein
MLEFILALLAAVRVFFRSRNDTALEILALRQQLILLKRKRPRPRLNPLDRLIWMTLQCLWSRWAEVLVVVKSEIVVSWHRAAFRLFWKWQSRARGGRPKATAEIRVLIPAWPKRIRPGGRPGSMENSRSWASPFANEP